MGARSKVVITMVLSLACAIALAGCTSSPSPSSSSSATTPTASSSSSSSGSDAPSAAGTATIDLDYSAGTGFEWSYAADPEGVVELVSQDTTSSAAEDVTGGALQDHFTFKAVKSGEVVLTFELIRDWEEDAEPANTQVYAFTVTDDLQMILNPYKSDFDNEPSVGEDQ